MRNLLLVGVLVSVSGCSAIDVAVMADSGTTYHGIDSGVAVEANKLLPSDAVGAAVTSAALKYGIMYGVKRFAPSACEHVVKSVAASSYGAAASNALVINDKDGIAVGVAVGVGSYFALDKSASKWCKR